MAKDRDVAAFDRRAGSYETGWRGGMHHDIARRTADLALQVAPRAERLLDVGCGTGYLLGLLLARLPGALELAGVDAAPSMIGVAKGGRGDERLGFSVGVAEHLPYPDQHFDLVVSTTSFDHWADQQAGLSECARVLVPGGWLVLADVFSLWLVPTLLGERRHKARTRRRVTGLVTRAGLTDPRWHRLYALVINGITATKPS